MFSWKVTEYYEWKQIEAISLILSNHYKLLEFLFEKIDLALETLQSNY